MSYPTIPVISVLMTVYNAESYLATSIKSIEQQTFQGWEFIIVDDASTDRSLAIAKSYAEKDARIKIISNAVNKGQTRCLNQGLTEARGAWIARQDADDLSHPERLERQWQRIQQEPMLALLGTGGSMIDHRGTLVGILDMPLTHELIRWSAAIKNPFLHTSVIFRAEVVQALGGYDERYQIAQDYDLWMRIMRYHRVANLPERLISYRHLEASLSKLKKNKAFKEANEIAGREEKNCFGRELRVDERLLLQKFREGESIKQQELLKFYNSFECHFSSISRNDRQRLKTIYYLQCAGSTKQNRYDRLRGVMRAFLSAPVYTLRWAKSRFFHFIY